MTTLGRFVREAGQRLADEHDPGMAEAVQIGLSLAVDKQADLGNSLNRWEPIAQCPRQLFGRQAISMVWDFAEGQSFGTASGSFEVFVDGIVAALTKIGSNWHSGQSILASATTHPLPDDSAIAFFTDPPYYDAVPYSDLSDFFYVWLKRTLPESLRQALRDELTPKADECIVDEVKSKDNAYFERTMGQAMAEGRRILDPTGIGVVVFAHKSTTGWEAQLQAMVDAGWTMTGSWPIDTENSSRLRAQDSAALASSVHLVCRPRPQAEIGDWREVLAELPKRIHEWMPRLAEAFRRAGLVEQTGRGVDKIFLGQLRYGRPAPDYSRSDATGVRVVLRGGEPSLQFAALVYEEDKKGMPLGLDELLVLTSLFVDRRIDAATAARLIQKAQGEARAVLERLHERGMIEGRGEKRGRVYHLSASLYRALGQPEGYVRSRGFDAIQRRQMILNLVDADGAITRKKAASLCQITEPQAYYLLNKLVENNELEMFDKGRGAHYSRKRRE